jgi:hypothetical protein
MKKRFAFLILILTTLGLSAQTYTHPTVGVASTYNGACLVSTCSGTYYDNGGAGGNYAASVNNIYRTFCPNAAGMCLRATFTSFSMNDTYFLCFGPSSCCDYLSILNGPAQNSPALYSNCTSSPGTVTASSANGCLTFRFVSDGSVQLAGWAATLSCVACGGGPSGTTNSDCAYATPICSDITFSDAATGPGIVAEGCSGCNTSEVYTNWYRIQIATSGTLAFTVNPNVNSDDFDPVVYGPGVTCGSLGTPIRCSYAAASGTGNTGLGGGALDTSEDVGGDQWVAPLNVLAGEVYYVLINGWSATAGSNGFALNWTGTAGLNCGVLSAEISDFTGEYLPDQATTELAVYTAAENGLDKLVIERKSDGRDWSAIHEFDAAGDQSMYLFYDPRPAQGINHYRTRMVDANGGVTYSKEITVNVPLDEALYVYPNPAEDRLTIEFGGTKAHSGTLRILNALGQEVYAKELTLEAGGMLLHEVSLSDLDAGVYSVKMGNQTVKFAKM